MLKAIKIRIYPNEEQKSYLSKLFGCYRKVFNLSLAHKKENYENKQTNIGLKELGNMFHNEWTKSNDFSYLNEHNTKILKQSIINLLDAYKLFFKRKEVGFPKFKSKHDNKQSVRFPIEAISKKNDFNSGKINLIKNLSNIPFRTSDNYTNYLIKHKDNIKSATLTKNCSGNYFLSILVDGDIIKKKNKTPNKLINGIDLGIKDFVISSLGEKFENIKSIRSNEKGLIRLQKRYSRKEKGSKNKEKARIRLARKHERIKNQKDNYLHLVANSLLDESKIIVIEDLNVKGMMKNHKLAKSIQELSLYKFKSILEYKAKWHDNIIIRIDRFFPSSKLCSCCSNKYKDLNLNHRKWTCPICNTTHDRDYNAAINIQNEGARMIMENEEMLSVLKEYIKNNKKVEINSSLLLEKLN